MIWFRSFLELVKNPEIHVDILIFYCSIVKKKSMFIAIITTKDMIDDKYCLDEWFESKMMKYCPNVKQMNLIYSLNLKHRSSRNYCMITEVTFWAFNSYLSCSYNVDICWTFPQYIDDVLTWVYTHGLNCPKYDLFSDCSWRISSNPQPTHQVQHNHNLQYTTW